MSTARNDPIDTCCSCLTLFCNLFSCFLRCFGCVESTVDREGARSTFASAAVTATSSSVATTDLILCNFTVSGPSQNLMGRPLQQPPGVTMNRAEEEALDSPEVIGAIESVLTDMNRKYLRLDLSEEACGRVARSINQFVREAKAASVGDGATREAKQQIQDRFTSANYLILNKHKIILGAFLGLAALCCSIYLLPYFVAALTTHFTLAVAQITALEWGAGAASTLGFFALGYKIPSKRVAGLDGLVAAVDQAYLHLAPPRQ